MKKLAVIVLLAFFLSGCHGSVLDADFTEAYTNYDLTSAMAVHLTGRFRPANYRIRTASSSVKVINRGPETVRMILYDLTDSRIPAMQQDVLPGNTCRFAGLIPQALYGFSLAVSKETPVDLVLFD